MATQSTQTSFVCATIFSVILVSVMQVQRSWLSSSQLHTIFGGYLGSLLFVFLLTAVGNLETIAFGSRFHTRLFPEVVFCIGASMITSGIVHRVCSTTCLIFSLVALYYMDRLVKSASAPPVVHSTKNSKKKSIF